MNDDDAELDEELSKKRQKFRGLCLPDEELQPVSSQSLYLFHSVRYSTFTRVKIQYSLRLNISVYNTACFMKSTLFAVKILIFLCECF